MQNNPALEEAVSRVRALAESAERGDYPNIAGRDAIDLRPILDALAARQKALERLANLTPHSANAHTAQDFCLTVRAIAESALANGGGYAE